jgi:hypothetical protein
MLRVDLSEVDGIAILAPDGQLSESDFISAARIIDPYIEKFGKLKGLLIHVKSFPGWDSFSALVTHLRFVREHHEKVSRVAFVTDSPIGTVAQNIAGHFINAEIKSFNFGEIEAARRWILDDDG